VLAPLLTAMVWYLVISIGRRLTRGLG
jgi:hypothetical protein